MTAPGGMQMSVLADHQGAAFSIIQPPQQSWLPGSSDS